MEVNTQMHVRIYTPHLLLSLGSGSEAQPFAGRRNYANSGGGDVGGM